MKFYFLIIVLAVLGAGHPGQAGTPLPEGFSSYRLKVGIAQNQPSQHQIVIIGMFVSLTNDSLEMIPEAPVQQFGTVYSKLGLRISETKLVVPLTLIRKLETRVIRKGKTLLGMGIGLLGGGAIGAMIGSTQEISFGFGPASPATGLGLYLGAAGGAVIGSVCGAIAGADTWREVDLNPFRERKTIAVNLLPPY